MKINVSGLSIAFYLFCGAVIFSEYSYVGHTKQNLSDFRRNAMVEQPAPSRRIASVKKTNWQIKTNAKYSSTNADVND